MQPALITLMGSTKKVRILYLNDLVIKSQDTIISYFNDYGINQDSLLTDIRKIIVHCTLSQLFNEFNTSELVILISVGNICNMPLVEIIGEDKCHKILIYLTNNLKKVFRHKFLEFKTLPSKLEESGELIEVVKSCKPFNFKELRKFFDKNSLSGLTKVLSTDLSMKQKIFSNFQ